MYVPNFSEADLQQHRDRIVELILGKKIKEDNNVFNSDERVMIIDPTLYGQIMEEVLNENI